MHLNCKLFISNKLGANNVMLYEWKGFVKYLLDIIISNSLKMLGDSN